MSGLVRAELLKLRSVRLPAWLLLAALGLVTLGVCVTVLTAGRGGVPPALVEPRLFRLSLGSAGAATTVVLVLGVLAVTQESRYGTATPTCLVTPRRERVLLAKLVAVTAAAALCAVVAVLHASALAVALLQLRGLDVVLEGPLAGTVLGVLLAVVLHGPLGVAVGALVRHQVAAVVGALAWTLVVEQLLAALLPGVARWLPGGATASVLGLGAPVRGGLLPPWAGALVLLAHAALLSALAARLALRRDLA